MRDDCFRPIEQPEQWDDEHNAATALLMEKAMPIFCVSDLHLCDRGHRDNFAVEGREARFHEFLELQRARVERVLLVHHMRKLDRGRRRRRKGKTQYEKKTQNRCRKPLVHRSSPFQNW